MIEVEHITHRYGERIALDDVSLGCDRGHMLALLGPNGSGKSTLFRLLSTATPIQSGSIRIDGFNLQSDRNRARALLGAAFQSPALDGQLTVLENLLCHAAVFGIDRAESRSRAQTLMERFGVADRARDRVSVLSGGLRRRVELVKALLTKPSVLLLDEPSAGLDPDARRQLRETLSSLRREGMTVVVATHDTDEADLADSVAVLTSGKLAGVGSPAALREQVGGTVLRVEAVDERDAIATLPEHRGRIASGLIVEYHVHEPHDLIVQLVPLIGRTVRSLQVGPPSLSAAYFQLTGRLLDFDS
jgi:ABC-2 type transport system ATP-binding protein